MDFSKLEKGLVRLEYGEAFSILGNTADVRISFRNAPPAIPVPPRPLTEYIRVSAVRLTYQVSGQAPADKTGEVRDDGTFSVPVDKLPEHATVNLKFIFSGALAPAFVNARLQQFVVDPRYKTIVEFFFQGAAGRSVADVEAKLREFAMAFAPLLNQDVPPELRISDTQTLAESLARSFSGQNIAAVAPYLRLFKRYENAMREIRAPEGASVDDLRRMVDSAIAAQRKAGEPITVFYTQFVETHDEVKGIFMRDVVQISKSLSVSLDAGVKDFEKFAGADVGAIYIPRVQELRAFLTVNIYFGTVEDEPAPVAKEVDIRGAASLKPKAGDIMKNAIKQRLSLSVGMSVKDLSGRSADKAKVSANNAFLVGLGWRLNKYFRITAGDALIRNKSDNRIGHALFIGPSIDVSAIQNLRTLFGKVK